MKLPVPKEEDGKRVMMTSGASTGRKALICERRETSLVGGHDTRSVQVRANMDLGSGDTFDHYAPSTDLQASCEPVDWNPPSDRRDFPPEQPAITKSYASGSTSGPSPTSKPPMGETLSFSSESINGNVSRERLSTQSSDADNSLEARLGRSADTIDSTSAVVEDGKEPNFTANESNPTVPAPTEPSKTSTLRLSDRTRSGVGNAESEDDIEKMDEPEQEGTLIGHEKNLYKTHATTDNSPNSEKIDKNGNRSDSDQNETDNDCVVQCLYYTIQCCECVIF